MGTSGNGPVPRYRAISLIFPTNLSAYIAARDGKRAVNHFLTSAPDKERAGNGMPDGMIGRHEMTLRSIEGGAGIIAQTEAAHRLIADSTAAYRAGCQDALYNLGVAFSTGSRGCACDLVEAHKWFNIAASMGHEEAAFCRADVADEMTAREIANAQREARRWLQSDVRKVA